MFYNYSTEVKQNMTIEKIKESFYKPIVKASKRRMAWSRYYSEINEKINQTYLQSLKVKTRKIAINHKNRTINIKNVNEYFKEIEDKSLNWFNKYYNLYISQDKKYLTTKLNSNKSKKMKSTKMPPSINTFTTTKSKETSKS